MNRSLIRWAALACTTAALALTSAGAFAQATLTLNDPNCSDFTLTGSAGARILNCVVTAVPACTVSGPASGTFGSAITLSANCSPAATSWAWTASGTPGTPTCNGATTQSCQDKQTSAPSITYTVTGSNGVGGGPTSGPWVVAWSNVVVNKPTGCSITASPTSEPVGGGPLSLAMNCTGGDPPDPNGYVWTGAFAAGNTGPTPSGTLTTTTTFTATASNAGGVSSPAATKNVTVSTGGGGGISCAAQGFANTRVIDMPWGATSTALTVDAGGFGPNDAVVVRFTTSNVTSTTSKGYIRAVEYSDPLAPRTGALSASPCDFGPGLPYVGGGSAAVANDTAPKVYFSLANAKTASATLATGTTYYFNMYNASCPSGSCNMQLYLVKPSGT